MAVLPLPAPSLVGRGRELDLLRRQLDAALAGRGGLVLIGGEAGIGKTALADALCREAAARGARILIGRCYDLTETPPYGLWLDLFGRYPPTDDIPPLPDAFATRGELGAVSSAPVLFRQVLDFFTDLTSPYPGGAGPAIVLLEDLQWADPASLDLLRALARSLPALPIVLLATYRGDELATTHPLTRLLPALVHEAPVERLDPRPLRVDDLATLVTGRYCLDNEDTTRLATYTHRRSEGNPLFVGELLRTLEEEEVLQRASAGWTLGSLTGVRVPPLLRQIIEGRAARLGAEARRLLGIAAVLGQEAPLDLWASVASATEGELLAALEQATVARLAEATADGAAVRFVHALIREALYEGMSPPVRRLVHRTAGDVLAAGRAPDPDAVASHFQRAGDDRALPWLLEAGERAQRSYARLAAVDRFEAAIALLEARGADAEERGWMLLRLGLLVRYADERKAMTFLERAAQAAAAGNAFLAACVRCNLGLLHCYIGERRVGVAMMAEAVDALDTLPPLDAASRERVERMGIAADPEHHRGLLALWLAYAGELRRARALAERVRARMPPTAAGAPLDGAFAPDAYRALGYIYAALGRAEEAREMYARNREAHRRIGEVVQVSMTSYFELRFLALQFRTDDIAMRQRLGIEIVGNEARALATTAGRYPPESWTWTFPLVALEGRWEEARRLLPVLRHEWEAACLLAPFARAVGERGVARDLVSAGFPGGPPTAFDSPHRFLDALILMRTGAALALDEDDRQSAREWLEAHDRWLAWSGAVLGRSEGQALWARYHRQAGDKEKARESAEYALAHAGDPRQPLALIAAHRLLGELDTDAGRYDDAARHLDASSSLADACQAPHERALTLLARAGLCAKRGNPDDATALLDAVRAICAPLGARPALSRADALAASLAPATPPPASPGGLTGREVEVLRHIAAGESNREIAAALCVSVRTVERHIENLYRKIGTRSKADATAYAFRHNLT
jgi:DNA-binding CsgD family transcriptional regulator